jgi:flagellar motility protein MotE (MotC chaperone)
LIYSLAAGNKRPCPFCDKFIALAQCTAVQLLVPDSHLILDDLSALLQQNECLQRQVEHVRTAVKAEKLKELAAVQDRVKEREMELQNKYEELERLQSLEFQFGRLELEREAVEEQNANLEEQNRELIKLIE